MEIIIFFCLVAIALILLLSYIKLGRREAITGVMAGVIFLLLGLVMISNDITIIECVDQGNRVYNYAQVCD